MARKYLTRDPVTGIQKLAAGVALGGTAAEAGELVALNAAGKLDISMVPTDDLTASTVTLPAFEDLSDNMYVNLFSDAGVPKARKADATTGLPAHAFVAKGVTATSNAVVYLIGMNPSPGLIVGTRYFLGAGGNVTTAPTQLAGQVIQFLGVAVPVNATEVGIQFEYDDVTIVE